MSNREETPDRPIFTEREQKLVREFEREGVFVVRSPLQGSVPSAAPVAPQSSDPRR